MQIFTITEAQENFTKVLEIADTGQDVVIIRANNKKYKLSLRDKHALKDTGSCNT